MQSARKANQALLAILGIDPMKRHITAIDIEIRPTAAPMMQITEWIDPIGLTDATAKQRFNLIPIDHPAPFDLDAMCDQARTAVQITIHMATIKHLLAMEASSPRNRQVKSWTVDRRAVDQLTRWDLPQMNFQLEGLA